MLYQSRSLDVLKTLENIIIQQSSDTEEFTLNVFWLRIPGYSHQIWMPRYLITKSVLSFDFNSDSPHINVYFLLNLEQVYLWRLERYFRCLRRSSIEDWVKNHQSRLDSEKSVALRLCKFHWKYKVGNIFRRYNVLTIHPSFEMIEHHFKDNGS